MYWVEKFWTKKDNNFFRKKKEKTSPDKGKVLKISSRWFIFSLLLLGLAIIQLYSGGTSLKSLNLNIGEIAGEDIVAEFSFEVPKKPEEIEKAKERALARIYPVLEFNEEVTQEQKNAIKDFFTELDKLKENKSDYQEQMETLMNWGWSFSQKSLNTFLTSEKSNLIEKAILEEIPKFFDAGIISDKRIRVLQNYSQRPILIQKNGKEEQVKLTDIHDEREVKEKLASLGRQLFSEQELADSFYEISNSFIIPNLTYNKPETERRINKAYDLISKIDGIIQKDEKIIGKHERVDDFKYRALQAYAAVLRDRMETNKLSLLIISRIGQIAFTFILIGAMLIYLRFYRKDIYNDNYQLILISILILFTFAFGLLIVNSNLSPYLIPLVFSSVLVAILIDEKFAVFLSLIIFILLGVFPSLSFYYRAVALIAAIVGSYTVHNLRHRHNFYRPMFFVSLTYIISIVAVDMIKLTGWRLAVEEIGFGVITAVGSNILAIGFLPVFESLFKITTNISLLELADFQQPLLKKLTMETPGTQSHSLIIGNLSEAAAEAIGADSLLCRVGSYYHDIGKTAKPEYFIENQRGYNPHDHLSPTMSTLIIISHVKEGIEMAKKAGLPQCIIDLILQHHGTSLVTYFFNKAIEQDETVNEHDFRYPGPKPQSKEAGIIMIADAVESAARSIKEATPQKLEAMIQKIINIKFVDGQFDECDLTLRDLHKIGEALLAGVMGITHSRIDYPDVKSKEGKDEAIYQSDAERDKGK